MHQKVIHKRSNVVTDGAAKLPTAEQLDYGELAINYADGHETITIKNSANEIVSFKSQEYIDDNDLFTKDTTSASGIVRKNGGSSTATGKYAFAEGYGVIASGIYSHAEGYKTTASGGSSHTEGNNTTASATRSHAEGYQTTASGSYSHAEGYKATAGGDYGSHAEGDSSEATGWCSHAEGHLTEAKGYSSHTEGEGTVASEICDHAEGSNTTASGGHSHAEGGETVASGGNSHAEGGLTVASGEYSHAEGLHTTASIDGAHAEGKYNVASTLSIHSVGIGTGTEDRKNAEDIIYSNGYKYLIGLGGYDGTNLTVTDEETESINPNIKSVQEIITNLQATINSLNDTTAKVEIAVPDNVDIRHYSTTSLSYGTHEVGEKGSIQFQLAGGGVGETDVTCTINGCNATYTKEYYSAGYFTFTVKNVCLQKYNYIAISLPETTE